MAGHRDPSAIPFSSNTVRLSLREWMLLGVVVSVAPFLVTGFWKRIEPFDPGADYRIPYEMSEDYWLFARYCGSMQEEDKVPLFGDSFVWGQYVAGEETLTHYLNQDGEPSRFANAGLDGAHPLAMEGLLKHHCPGLEDRDLILHFNPLWLSSPQADLQAESNLDFNHPRLIPQFKPRIPSYREAVSQKIGVVVARHVPVFDWVRHLRRAYFGGSSLTHWSLENPYRSPLGQIRPRLPQSSGGPPREPQPWFVDSRGEQALPWVELESSLQWQALRRLVGDLGARGNRVLVTVGPLNEHMMEPATRADYRQLLEEVEDWLKTNGVDHLLPPLLPSELYADLSHPLDQGYALLADQIQEALAEAAARERSALRD